MFFRLLMTFVVFGVSAFAGPPSIKAKMDEPVVEELMGGCSLKCAFDWTADVLLPGAKKWTASRVLDDDTALSAWVAPSAKTSVGMKIRMTFPKKLRSEEEGTIPLYGIDLVNGYWKTEDLWQRHARVKRARLDYNGKPLCQITFADSRCWQRVEFPDVFIKSGDTMTFEVLEIYPGKGGPLAITELVLQGAH
jgi:hypothetical protein